MKTMGRPRTNKDDIRSVYSIRLKESDKEKITQKIGAGSFTVGVEKMLSLYERFDHIERKMSEKLRHHANGFAFAIDAMERAKYEGQAENYKKFTSSCLAISEDILKIYDELGDDENRSLLRSLFNDDKYTGYLIGEIKKRKKKNELLHPANS